MLGMPTVMVGGFPVPSTQDIAKFLKNKLKGLKGRKKPKAGEEGEESGGGGGCPG
jgi:hypothetical protein